MAGASRRIRGKDEEPRVSRGRAGSAPPRLRRDSWRPGHRRDPGPARIPPLGTMSRFDRHAESLVRRRRLA